MAIIQVQLPNNQFLSDMPCRDLYSVPKKLIHLVLVDQARPLMLFQGQKNDHVNLNIQSQIFLPNHYFFPENSKELQFHFLLH